ADMDEIIADVLGDGEFGYLDRSGRQVGNAAVIVEEGVERMEAGAVRSVPDDCVPQGGLAAPRSKGGVPRFRWPGLADRRHPFRRRRLDHFDVVPE
ncbi:hypothetical protein ACG3QZ_05545, partial [Pseudomonas aeruginosa]